MPEDQTHRDESTPGDRGEPGAGTPSSTQVVQDTSNAPTDRADLVARARTFLTSPHIRYQDSDAKRAFLVEKGLTGGEIDLLLRELPPTIPPRTYPAPPPSNLPNLLIGIARIFTWLTGTSAVILFIYYRYLLPRLTRSYQARLALRNHQSTLISRLTESASALRAEQTESYKDLPRPTPVYEDPEYAGCHTVDDLLSRSQRSGDESNQQAEDVPDVTIIRCTLEELSRTKEDGSVSTEELFQHLEGKLPWLSSEAGAARQSDLWNQLNSCPLFTSSPPKATSPSPLPPDHPSRLLWKYVPPPLPSTPPALISLANLQAALPRAPKAPEINSKLSSPPTPTLTTTQRTLQVLSDFTGYITTQTYSLGVSSVRGVNGVGSSGNPAEDELRREIRALKGLVLNRRSFLPPARPMSEPPRASDI
ncbi:hypothetical protein HYDPIDRAFT_78947 [Hydnomerulius pinastri MD-312]|nr:hypothetical protein HYDPIDRAFT_78947 [Hydnomerulius pinastri MD-312]